ncbi:hypothetical protein [Comamonas serinivorans]|nr:hypothetical protein [Comamonas serinivorans]
MRRLAWRPLLVWLAVAAVLALVLAAYAAPGLMVAVADQVWSCF